MRAAAAKDRRAAFSVADPDFYQRAHVTWRHASGINVEAQSPGLPAACPALRVWTATCPSWTPKSVDAALTEQGFVKDSPKEPADRYTVWGQQGTLAAFMEVVDREGWSLSFNEQCLMTPFCNGREQDDQLARD